MGCHAEKGTVASRLNYGSNEAGANKEERGADVLREAVTPVPPLGGPWVASFLEGFLATISTRPAVSAGMD
jgi:hypothetical protein